MINQLLVLLELQKPVSTSAERNLLIYMVGVLLVLCALIIVFFVVFQKRKNKLIRDKILQQQAFEEELSNTQIEIQEETLKNIGQELHDNIGQLLSVANMQLSIMAASVDDAIKNQFIETKDVVKDSLREVRALSKSLNSDVIANRGFLESIKNEVDRLNRLQLIKAEFKVEGDSTKLQNNKDSIILFRIFQEFLSNTIKYASAENFMVTLQYLDDKLIIKSEDNGKGFDVKTIESGAGLLNMDNRSKLVKANFKLESAPGKGTSMIIDYPYRVAEALKL
ncbi:sensor histidine kinase [Hanstruepera marina]|uniref:sensor histidine kinase n=1 Tax=Hanstruepera marina TaxID=2873265 RepID=UPI002102F92D|nr:histidine kinase [Hanstruepera marina]